jgi:hypothetical protein
MEEEYVTVTPQYNRRYSLRHCWKINISEMIRDFDLKITFKLSRTLINLSYQQRRYQNVTCSYTQISKQAANERRGKKSITTQICERPSKSLTPL